MKLLPDNWKTTLASLWARVKKPKFKGITAIPGQKRTIAVGKLKIPLINWDKLYRKSFLYNCIASAICGYFVADFLVLALSPWYPIADPPRPRMSTTQERKTLSKYEIIFARNLFNEKGLIPNADEGQGYDGPPVKTSLPLNLLGVIVVSDPTKSVASIDDKSSNQVLALRINERIGRNNATVQQIESDRVIFFNESSQRREYVELPKDMITTTRRSAPTKGGGIVSSGGNRFLIDRKEVDATLANLNEVLTQARCVPHMENGQADGYECFQIVPGSIYDKLGMKDGDVICGINGQPVNDPARAFSLLTELKNSNTRNIELCIKRNKQVMNMSYEIN
ncbi:MAG: hypothetical protein M9962_00415 [Oligoflexia bacterium]|nr:hypothetical protein [Oligoflexia bacterium]